MRFLILGPLTVVDGDRTVVLAGRRQRTTMAVLLANAGQVVPLDYLVDALWEDDPPATARRQVQNDISALRRALVSGAASEPAIVGEGHGYRIRIRPGELDAQVFADLVADALDQARRGEPAVAVTTLRSALRLWRGAALLGLTGRAVEAAAARLEEQRLAAVEQCFDLELALGKQRELVGEIAEQVAAHPLRERLAGQLMRALHGSGRQPEALVVYDQLRARLADELRLTPGRALQQLHSAILRGDPAVEPSSEAPVVAGRAPEAPAQLPADVSGFTGRADHLRGLDELLPARARAATAVVISAIAGTAGIGKTALAVHWGHRVRAQFPDGQLYVDLRGFAPEAPVRPVEALAHLLRSLGEPAERIPTDVQTAGGRYRSLLANRQLLVVLDNAVDADQVRPLLPGSSGCLVLVTSRDRLTGLLAREGARSVTLDVLTRDEAHTLLATILGRDRVAAEPAATAELARICSYLPLALRVAAANLTSHPWPSIADYVAALRAGDRLTELDVDGDEETGVRRAFDLSYRTLPADTRRVFRLLGLVPGPDVTAEAVAALAGTGAAHARRLLDRLVTVHLVNQPGHGRYTCHDLLRHYAAERAGSEDTVVDREAALRRLHDWYLHGADRAAGLLYPHTMRLPVPAVDVPNPATMADEEAALGWLDAERVNLVATIRHAAEHGPRSVAWLLADTLRAYFWLRMHTVDWQTAARVGLTAAEAEGELRAQAAAQLSLGDCHSRLGQAGPAIERYAAALTLAERTGWVRMEAATIGNLGVMYRDSGRLRRAVGYLDRGLKLCRANGWRSGEAITLDSLARAYLQMGRLARAGECGTEALTINREIGSRLGEASALGELGEVLHARGRLDAAAEHLTGALPLFQELGDRTNEAFTMRVLAAVRCDQGDTAAAAELGHAALALARELNERRLEADVLNTLGAVAHRTDRHRDAVEHHEQARELARAIGEPYPEAQALIGLAAEHRCLGDHERALGHARRALAIAREAEYGVFEERAQTIIDASA
ncbi:BTAD domain-containing putative transcriptional regulator [Actinomycetes bacterium KLBMP 9797]